jgi:hypothetical protein
MDYRIIGLLNTIKEKPGIHIGRKSLLDLWHFVHGYQHCLEEIEGKYPEFVPGFQEYIEDRYNFHGVHSWAHIIQFYSVTDESAFDTFYKHLDEFLNINNHESNEGK